MSGQFERARTRDLLSRTSKLFGFILIVTLFSANTSCGQVGSEEVSFEASDGYPLKGKLYLPKDSKGKVPIVLLFYTMPKDAESNPFSSPNTTNIDDLARGLISEGIAFLSVNTGRIEPGTALMIAQLRKDTEKLERYNRNRLLDVEGVLRFLGKRTELDLRRIGGIGFFQACSALRLVSLNDPGFRALVMAYPDGWRYEEQKDAIRKTKDRLPTFYFAHPTPAPVKDETAFLNEKELKLTEEFYRLSGEKARIEYKHAKEKEVWPLIIRWFTSHLKGK